MRWNYAIIEVKAPRAPLRDIKTDLEKLALFVNGAGYQRAIYLHYGYDNADVVERVGRIASLIDRLPPIELWLHSNVGEPAQLVSKLEGKG